MRLFLALLLLAALTTIAYALTVKSCSYTCYKRTCTRTGWLFWRRKKCSNKRATCYKPCPVPGGWTNFSDTSHTQCSVTCGQGTVTVTQTRSCTNPAPQHGGADCQGPDTLQLTRTCHEDPCPIPGGWTNFSDTSHTQCSVTCGQGTMTVTQTRSCTNPAPQHGGDDCQGPHSQQVTRTCSQDPCPIDGGWSAWGAWRATSNCTVLCGGGEWKQTRHRSCTNPPPQYGGNDCGRDNDVENRMVTCNNQTCGSTCEGARLIPASDKRYFYQCTQGNGNTTFSRALLHKCAEGTVWNQTMTSCVHEETTISVISTEEGCVENTKSAVPGNCSFFSWCVHGILIIMPCPPGLQFNNGIQTCDHPDNFAC